jgi:hypothetical protein
MQKTLVVKLILIALSNQRAFVVENGQTSRPSISVSHPKLYGIFHRYQPGWKKKNYGNTRNLTNAIW